MDTSGPPEESEEETADVQQLSQSSNQVNDAFEEDTSILRSLDTDCSHASMGKLAKSNTDKAFSTPSAKLLSADATAKTVHKQQKVIIETMVRE